MPLIRATRWVPAVPIVCSSNHTGASQTAGLNKVDLTNGKFGVYGKKLYFINETFAFMQKMKINILKFS
jgi:hypothetical protein